MSLESLYALADRAALFTALRQDQLATAVDALGEHRWDADLEKGQFFFTSHDDPARTIEARPHLIASIAPGPRSLMWSWALPQGDATGATEALRAYGEQNGIPELTQAEVPFPPTVSDDDLPAWLASFSHAIAGAAVEITGLSPYYLGQAGASKVVLLLDAPLPALTVAHAVATLPRMLSQLELRDPRSSVWDLGRLAGWSFEWSDPSFSAAVASDASGSATFRFDEYARITGIQGTLSGH